MPSLSAGKKRDREAPAPSVEKKREHWRRAAAVQRAKPGYKEKAKAYMSAWYAANKEAISAARRKKPEDKKKTGPPKRFTEEEQKAKQRSRVAARRKDPEYKAKERARAKEHYALEETKAYRKAWRELNKDLCRQYCAAFRLRNLESMRARDRDIKRKQCVQLDEAYLKALNRNSEKEVTLQVRRASVIFHRLVIKGVMNVDQANEILELHGSSARI